MNKLNHVAIIMDSVCSARQRISPLLVSTICTETLSSIDECKTKQDRSTLFIRLKTIASTPKISPNCMGLIASKVEGGYGRGYGRGYGIGYGRGYGRGYDRGYGRGYGRRIRSQNTVVEYGRRIRSIEYGRRIRSQNTINSE